MTIREFIQKLEALNIPDAEVLMFEVDSQSYQPITGWVYDKKEIQFYSDI